ncbi:MAG TPA: hypothetical protein VMG58_04540 [Candidatus Sulfotelmatobacter sp.]|nr:hypothetical protein [Candidatus Sulfotelmatobacter sp.]
MQRLLRVAVRAILVLTLWAPAVGAQQPPSGPPTVPPQQVPRAGERHPQIRAAMRALTNAERHLQEAAHDYGGHRVKAMELIKQAQEELQAGLAWDRAHEQQRP